MNQCYVFDETREAIDDLEASIQEFMFALVGSWNLRCNIEGLLRNAPSVSSKDLSVRCSLGAGVVGCDFRKQCETSTWDGQKSSLSWMLLNSTCAIFESWIDRLLGSNYVKPLQQVAAARKCLKCIVDRNKCKEMEVAFFRTYCANPKYSADRLEVYLSCYTLFKEMRNAYMHVGRRATEGCAKAYKEFVKNCTEESMRGSVPAVPLLNLGTPIVLDYRGVIGFTNIVICLLRTYDIMLLPTNNARTAFVSRAKCLDAKMRDFSQLNEITARRKMCRVLAQARIAEPEGKKAARKIFEDGGAFKFGKAW